MADKIETVRFVCPKCGDIRLECCEYGPYVSLIKAIDEDGDFEYGPVEASGEVDRFQCVNCGYILKNKDHGDIRDNDGVVEWCLENCPQD